MASDVAGMRALLEIGAVKKTLECQVDETPQGAARRMCRRAARAESRVVELEAIVAGRATPPTYAEINAHAAAGGSWLVRYGYRTEVVDAAAAKIATESDEPRVIRWWSVDQEHCLCAWPAVEVPR